MYRNRNREHAVQQLKKYMKAPDDEQAEIYLNACFANAMIYLGDSAAILAESFSDAKVASDDDDITESD